MLTVKVYVKPNTNVRNEGKLILKIIFKIGLNTKGKRRIKNVKEF